MQLSLDEAITAQLALRLAIKATKAISQDNLYLTDLRRMEDLEVDVTKFVDTTLRTPRW